MTIDTLIMLGGAIVVALPFLGFPNSWDNILYILTGAMIIALGIVVRRHGKNLVIRGKAREQHFVESEPMRETREAEPEISHEHTPEQTG